MTLHSQRLKKYAKSITILFLLFSSQFLHAQTRPELDSIPFGFANNGTPQYHWVRCDGSATTPNVYYCSDDADVSAALGSDRVLMLAAGEYDDKITIDGYDNLSIIGEGNTDVVGFSIKNSATNILIRNISVTRYPNDGLSITGGDNIWIDHCTIGYTVTSSNKEIPDGAMDITGGPDFITVSWSKFQNSWKTSLHGSSDSDLSNRHITWYCNHIVNTNQRTPRIRSGETHVINNCYENTGWFRHESMTDDEFTWNEEATYKDDGEYYTDRRIVTFGYAIMAALDADVVVENNFFWDVRWPICASLPVGAFETRYGDLQSPDINNHTNSGCDAVYQFGNEYDDSGLPDTLKIKDANESSATAGTMYAPLDYEYVHNSETRWVIKPAMLNPGGRSIIFDEFNPGGAFDPTGYTYYFPAGFTAMTAQEVWQTVPQYAGADGMQYCPTGAAPTLTTPTNKDQTNVITIDPIVFTWGGGAIDVKVFGLPLGLTAVKNTGAKTLTISGTPTTEGPYTVTTEGGTGADVSVSGSITFVPPIVCLTMLTANITSVATQGTYRLALFDAPGTTEIKTLATGLFSAGATDFSFPSTGLSAGTYTFKLLDGVTVMSSGSVVVP